MEYGSDFTKELKVEIANRFIRIKAIFITWFTELSLDEIENLRRKQENE